MLGSGRWPVLAALALLCIARPCTARELTLDQARERARTHNLGLQAARERLHQVGLTVDKAWVMVKPQLTATGTYTHHGTEAGIEFPDITTIQYSLDPAECDGDPFCITGFERYNRFTIQKQDSFGFSAVLSQPLFLARAYTTISNAYHARDLAELNHENLEDFLLHSVEMAYYGALGAEKLLAIARNSAEIRREHLRVARAKFEVGDAPKITALRAEIDVNRCEQDVKRAENALELSKEALGLLTDLPAEEIDLVPPEPARRPARSMQAFIDEALGHRRDLQTARTEHAMAEKLEQDAWARFLPSLALTGMFRVSDVKGFTDEYYSWNVGLALSIPLYDGGMRYAALEEARSKIRQAEIEIEETRRKIASEIRQLWLKVEMAEANLEKARRSVELAREQVELSRVSFEAGAVTNLEVLDANSMLFVAETTVVQEELNLQLAIVRLSKSVTMFNPAGSLGAAGVSVEPGPAAAEASLPASGMSLPAALSGLGGM
ncbi:MAG: TolC family protein [Deltaproteobacteria bacterium]|nr:TolC family protein [Deltaproteobacteria bacterium]